MCSRVRGLLTSVWWQKLSQASWLVHVEDLSHVEVVLGHVLDNSVHSLGEIRFDLGNVYVTELSWDGELKLDASLLWLISNPL